MRPGAIVVECIRRLVQAAMLAVPALAVAPAWAAEEGIIAQRVLARWIATSTITLAGAAVESQATKPRQ